MSEICDCDTLTQQNQQENAYMVITRDKKTGRDIVTLFSKNCPKHGYTVVEDSEEEQENEEEE